MRIAFFCPSPLLPTGIGKVARKLIRGLVENGYQVVVGNFQHAGEPLTVDGAVHFPLFDADTIPIFLEKTRPDLAIGYFSHWVPPYSRIGSLCEKLGVRYMQYVTLEFSSVSLHWLEPLTHCNFFAVSSDFSRRLLLKHGVPEEKIKVVYHGVDMSVYRPIEPRPRFAGYEDKLFFGFVARNSVRKGFSHIMRAFAMLPKKVRESSMLYFHTARKEESVSMLGPTRGWDIPLLAVKYNLQGKILLPDERATKWMGYSEEELARTYNALDVYTHASTGEGFGLPILEAMACGLPVIASANTSVPEVVGDAGILTPCFEEDDETLDGFTISSPKIRPMAEAMLELYQNEPLRRKLGRLAQERARQFTWSRAINGFCEAVEQALRQDRIGPGVLRASEPIEAEGVWLPHANLIPQGRGRCLDVGSGPSALWKWVIEERGYEYVSLDRKSSKKVDVVAEVPPLPFGDKAFELVFSRNLLEHLPTEKQLEFLEECRRVGKKALVIFTTPESPHFYIDPDHYPIDERVYSFGRFRRDNGNGIVEIEGDHEPGRKNKAA